MKNYILFCSKKKENRVKENRSEGNREKIEGKNCLKGPRGALVRGIASQAGIKTHQDKNRKITKNLLINNNI